MGIRLTRLELSAPWWAGVDRHGEHTFVSRRRTPSGYDELGHRLQFIHGRGSTIVEELIDL